MWSVYQQATTWSSRPSELLDIDEPYSAFCLDEAVLAFGSWVESELSKVDAKTPEEAQSRRAMVLKRILGGKPLFADPLTVKQPVRPEEAT